jgi:hypothetical protein
MKFQVVILSLIGIIFSPSIINCEENIMPRKISCPLINSESSCEHIVYLTVKNSSGVPLQGLTIEYKLCASPGSCTDTLYKAASTDSEGKSEIWWRYYCDICQIYINGVEYTGPFINGGSYELIY